MMPSPQQQNGVQKAMEPPWAFPGGNTTYRESLWLKHGEIYRQTDATATSTLLLCF
jgi:hypothetical protein